MLRWTWDTAQTCYDAPPLHTGATSAQGMHLLRASSGSTQQGLRAAVSPLDRPAQAKSGRSQKPATIARTEPQAGWLQADMRPWQTYSSQSSSKTQLHLCSDANYKPLSRDAMEQSGAGKLPDVETRMTATREASFRGIMASVKGVS